MAKKQLRVLEQFRLPADISAWLKKEAGSIGKTKTQIVVEALRDKLAMKKAS